MDDVIEQTKQELTEDFRASTADDRRMVELFQGLVASTGWQTFEKFLQEQLKTRRDVYELSPKASEYMRGEIGMLRLVLQMPYDIIAGGKTAIELRAEEFENRMKELDNARGDNDDS